jgi:hypothetical protein
MTSLPVLAHLMPRVLGRFLGGARHLLPMRPASFVFAQHNGAGRWLREPQARVASGAVGFTRPTATGGRYV